MVPKKPEHRRLRGDWSLKNINNMADSSEKVSFRVDMQCSSLRAKAFLVFDRGSQPIGRHLANKLLTCCQQSADCWQKIFVKGGKRQSADCWLGELFFIFSQECLIMKKSHGSRNQVLFNISNQVLQQLPRYAKCPSLKLTLKQGY